MDALYLLLLFAVVVGQSDVAVGQDRVWPESYSELDDMLSRHSQKYRAMADHVRTRHGYRITTGDQFLGNVRDEDGGAPGLVIEVGSELPNSRRATTLIWEMANAFQRATFSEISRRALRGEIANHREFGLRMELVEYGSFLLHLEVLQELSQAGFEISEDFFFFLSPETTSLRQYRIPSVHDYVDAQASSGHTRHYEKWFYLIQGKEPPFEN